MPSLARMLGLMLVLAGPLGLAAQTVPSQGPWNGPSSAGPGAIPAARAYQPNRYLPATASMRPDPYAGRVVPASHQAPADSFSQEPRYAHGAASIGGLSPESGSRETLSSGNLPLPPPRKSPALPLSPPGRSNRGDAVGPGGMASLVTAVSSLALVLGVFFLVAWGMRRARPAGMTALPGEVFEVLGRAPMANRQQVHLLRCGSKLLLVCVTPAGTETLTEIVDPMEVDRLSGLCRQTRPGSATEAFRQVLGQFAPQQPDSGSLSRLFAGRDRAGRDREDQSRDGLDTRMAPSELEDQNV